MPATADPTDRCLQLVYDAAMEPGDWPAAMRSIADVVGGCASTLHSYETQSRDLLVFHQYGMSGDMAEEYEQHFRTINPRAGFARTAAPGVIFDDASILSPEEMRRSEFYEEFLAKYGWRYFAGASLNGNGAMQTAFSVQFLARRGPATGEERSRLSLIAPHLDRAARLSTAFGDVRWRSAAADEALEKMSLGVAILDVAGRVVHVNAALRGMAAQGDGIRLSGHQLAFGQRFTDRPIARVLGLTLAAVRGRSSAAGGIAHLVRPSGRRPYQVTVVPLANSEALFARVCPAVIVFVADPDASLPPPDALSQLYRLTPKEAEVAALLAAGQTVHTIAARLGMAERTVRVHLSAAFAKTGTTRQAELVRLIGAISR